MAVRVPAESLCFDVLLHREAIEGEPVLGCFSLVNTEFPFRDPEARDAIPIAESLSDLGSASGVAGLPDVPGHAALLERVVAATGCGAEEFRSYRIRMRFPPLPICLAVSYWVRGPRVGTGGAPEFEPR